MFGVECRELPSQLRRYSEAQQSIFMRFVKIGIQLEWICIPTWRFCHWSQKQYRYSRIRVVTLKRDEDTCFEWERYFPNRGIAGAPVLYRMQRIFSFRYNASTELVKFEMVSNWRYTGLGEYEFSSEHISKYRKYRDRVSCVKKFMGFQVRKILNKKYFLSFW